LASLALGCDVALVRGLSREDAQAMSVELERNGVVARVVADRGAQLRLEVNEAAVADAVSVLARRDVLPAPAALSDAWIETPGELRAREAVRTERALEASLLRLPNVREARVHITPAAGLHALPETHAPPAASVLIVRTPKSDSIAAHAQALVAGAVPGLSPATVRVVEIERSHALPPLQLARIGPIVVSAQSAATLKGWIAGSLVVHMLLAGALLWPLVRTLRKPRPSPRP
jgi:type III secretory pathway lipoprotein EscJ